MRFSYRYLSILVYGFFSFFFMIYIGKYGLANFILAGDSVHIKLLNIGIWFVLTMYCFDGLFKEMDLIKKEFKNE